MSAPVIEQPAAADALRLLSPAALSGSLRELPAHRATYGPLPTSIDLAGLAEAAGLTGRGGAGFPTHRKLAAVAAGRRPVVVANGAEGEPASGKDRTLLQLVPHLVLDGLLLACRAVGSAEAYAYVPDGPMVQTLQLAADLRRTEQRVRVVGAPHAFIAGEESAVVQGILGHGARPTNTPPRVFERGIGGRPTLVLNVETLAQLALLARAHGGPPYSRLFTVSGSVRRPSVVEMATDCTARQLIAAVGGPTYDVQAVLVGGYHGAWLPYGPLADLPLTDAALRPLGAHAGAGVLVALPAGACGLRETARVLGYLAAESSGQCGPCLSGLPALAAAFSTVAGRGATRASLERVQLVTGLVEGRGACHHPDGSVRFARSALRAFGDELHRHLAGTCIGEHAGPVLPLPERQGA